MTTAMTTAQRWTLILTAIAAFMVPLDQLVVATSLTAIRSDLHASLATIDWTVNSYSLSFAVLLITGATLGDRFGRRRMFVTGLALFALASAACALAPGLGTLIAARTVQGAGSALVAPLAVALLTSAFPPERRGPVVGLFTAIVGLAVVGGPVVGGAVTQGIAWPWIFWLNVPIGLALIPLVRRHVAESRGPRVRFDPVGLVLVSTAMFGLTWGLIRADAAGWSSAEVIASLACGALLTAAFVAWELRVAAPMLPMHLFANRTFAAGNASMLLQTASLLGTVFVLAQYLQISRGHGPLAAGLHLVPWTVTVFLVAPFAGVLTGRWGSRPVLAAGLALQGAGFAWLALGVANDVAYPVLSAALVVAGVGTSMALPASQNAIMNAVEPANLGHASGTFNSVRQLGGVFGVAIASAVFAANGSYASPARFADGVAPALAVSSVIAIAGAGLAVLIHGRRRPATRPVFVPPATVEADVLV